MHIQLYDKSTVDQIKWPDTEQAKSLQDLLVPMMKEGVQTFIQNVSTELYLLQLDDQIIPITVNQAEYDNSYLTSNYFPVKHLEEKLVKDSWRSVLFKKTLIKSYGFLLKGIKINKAVIVNNWLLTTSIHAELSQETIEKITSFLKARFPDHLLIFRSLNMRKCGALAQDLKKQSYRLLFARHVMMYDPAEKQNLSSKVLYHHRRDRRLIEDEGYEVCHYEKIESDEAQQVLKLYGDLYLSRHTKYSPQYTEKFLKSAVEKGFLRVVGLKKEGEVQGVIGFHQREGTLITPFCGYDQTSLEAGHLYRMLTMLAIDEAEKERILLNDGSGGEAPKQYRGMKSVPEYVALYDRHLPLYRRLFWKMAEKMVSKITAPKKRS